MGVEVEKLREREITEKSRMRLASSKKKEKRQAPAFFSALFFDDGAESRGVTRVATRNENKRSGARRASRLRGEKVGLQICVREMSIIYL